jgi:hypothetical protein
MNWKQVQKFRNTHQFSIKFYYAISCIYVIYIDHFYLYQPPLSHWFPPNSSPFIVITYYFRPQSAYERKHDANKKGGREMRRNKKE